ncbi:hypothetical protein ACOSQ4_006821 [Xanthoceras sorbifolium]
MGKILATSQVNREAFKGLIDPIWKTPCVMLNFRDVIADCGLSDLDFIGAKFTWNNKQAGTDNVQERLDRVLVNQDWGALFPRARVSHFYYYNSNHRPLLVSLLGKDIFKGVKSSRACPSIDHLMFADDTLHLWSKLFNLSSWHVSLKSSTGQTRMNNFPFTVEGPLVNDVLNIFSILGGLSFDFVSREGNKVSPVSSMLFH